MLPDLERLIHLQELDSRLAAAHQTVAGAPEREAALDARLTAARAAVDAAKAAIAENQNTRRSVDKDLLASHGVVDAAYKKAVGYGERAKAHLTAAFPASTEREALLSLVDYVLSRDR